MNLIRKTGLTLMGTLLLTLFAVLLDRAAVSSLGSITSAEAQTCPKGQCFCSPRSKGRAPPKCRPCSKC